MKLTIMGKVALVLMAVGLVGGAYRYWNKFAPMAKTTAAVQPKSVKLPAVSRPSVGSPSTVDYQEPGNDAGCSDKPTVKLLGYAWNGQMGLQLAIGGEQATKGSLMCKYGVNMKFERQDDNAKLQEALVAFATQLSNGEAQPTEGAHFVTIMGDGGAVFMQGLNNQLKRLGPEYQAKIVDAIGYSRGEDKFMGLPMWKLDPTSAKGGVVTGVLRDGDWNIAQKWLGDNGLKNNPDEKTYDPDALNWVAASDYVDAAQKYVTGYSESRPVVKDGVRTGETKKIEIQGVVTWTPGDVTVAKERGGLISLASTKEYSAQMPTVVIGIDKWCRANRKTVENMIRAIGEGGDQIESSNAALQKGASISAVNYHEQDGEYWAKYFKGVTEQDKTGMNVELGGSSVNNLAESLLAFGLVPGSSNLVAATYTEFGNVVTQQYPDLISTFPPAGEVIDSSYLRNVATAHAPSPSAIVKARPAYNYIAAAKRKPTARTLVGRKSYAIHFNQGSAEFSPDAEKVLYKLLSSLLVAQGTIVEIAGHTDSAGNPATSLPLSQRRANAVKQWLESRSPINFPNGRIKAVGRGESQPVANNATSEGRAKNRRVEIILRSV